MKKSLDHVGIAVKNLQEVKKMYANLLDIQPSTDEIVHEQGVRVSFIETPTSSLELLAPLNEDSPIHRFIEKKGEGLHHIAFKVSDIELEIKKLEQKGFQLIDKTPRTGAKGKLIAFLHPKSTNGVLIELCEKV